MKLKKTLGLVLFWKMAIQLVKLSKGVSAISSF